MAKLCKAFTTSNRLTRPLVNYKSDIQSPRQKSLLKLKTKISQTSQRIDLDTLVEGYESSQSKLLEPENDLSGIKLIFRLAPVVSVSIINPAKKTSQNKAIFKRSKRNANGVRKPGVASARSIKPAYRVHCPTETIKDAHSLNRRSILLPSSQAKGQKNIPRVRLLLCD